MFWPAVAILHEIGPRPNMIGYFLAIIPLYIFVYLPLSRIINGPLDPPARAPFPFDNVAFDDEALSCAAHSFSTFILSREPLVIYISSFISDSEADHLLEVSRDKFAESTVSTGPAKVHDPAVRDSEVAMLEADDEVLRCIEARARALQGWRPRLRIERLQLQRYGPAGHYKHHFDWHGGRGVDRISSFLVYVDANCTGGGTEFPRLGIESETLTRGEGRRWCQFVECDEDGNLQGAGVTFRPVRGNAVYWENLRADGEGYQETWHAGLPVLTGTKVGLNIWSWYQF